MFHCQTSQLHRVDWKWRELAIFGKLIQEELSLKKTVVKIRENACVCVWLGAWFGAVNLVQWSKCFNRTKMVLLYSVFDGCPGDLVQPKNLQYLKPIIWIRSDYESPLTTGCEFESSSWEAFGGLSVEALAPLLPLLEPLVLAGTDVGLCSVMVSTGPWAGFRRIHLVKFPDVIFHHIFMKKQTKNNHGQQRGHSHQAQLTVYQSTTLSCPNQPLLRAPVPTSTS